MIFTPEPGTNPERSLHFITQGLEHPHEFHIYFMLATTTFAGHLIDGQDGANMGMKSLNNNIIKVNLELTGGVPPYERKFA